MRRQLQLLTLGLLTFLTVFAASGTSTAGAWVSQDPHDHGTPQSTPQAQQPAARGRGLMGGSGRMGAPVAMNRDQMMAKMKADDTRIATAVSRMNEAKGEAKVAAMADLLNLLVNTRQEMLQMMAACPMGMMAGTPAK